ncbi:hypothetical protein GCM10027299_42440 [Larkinella ripae]
MDLTILARQLEAIAIAQTVPKAFGRTLSQAGTFLPVTDTTHYTLFFNPHTGLVSFDLNWDQGDAFSGREEHHCHCHNLIVAGYYSQYEIQTLSLFDLAERIYHFLKDELVQ